MPDAPDPVQETSDQGKELALPEVKGAGHSVNRHGGDRLNPMQRAFALAYVLNGGVADAARIDAGYSSPTMGVKNLQNGSILREIKRLSVMNLDADLPQLIRRAKEIAFDPKTPQKEALIAIFGLMDRAGVTPPKGPLVAIQNNSYGDTKGLAQTIIQEVWNARTARLSGIAVSMADKPEEAEPDPDGDDAGTHRGGDHPSGAPPASVSVTPHEPTRHGFSPGPASDQPFAPEDAEFTSDEDEE